MEQELEKIISIEKKLTNLKIDLNKQIQAMDLDKKDDDTKLQDDIVKISSSTPNQIEILKFVIFVNDKLETKLSMYSNILKESIDELIELKLDLIDEVKENKQKIQYSSENTVLKKSKDFLLYLSKIRPAIMIIISIIFFIIYIIGKTIEIDVIDSEGNRVQKFRTDSFYNMKKREK